MISAIVRSPIALAMLFYQSIMLAIGQIWANKVRGILTTIGILIGVAAVAAVITLLTGMRDRVLSEFEAFGTNKIFVGPNVPENSRTRWRDIMFRLGDFDEMLEKCPSVATFTHMRWQGGTLTHGSKTDEENIVVLGVDPTWHAIEHRWVTEGRPMSVLDNATVRAVCWINTQVRDKLGLDRDPTGEIIDWDGNRLMVMGLLEPPATSLGQNPETREVLIPFRYAVRKNRQPDYFVIAASRSPEQSEEAKAEIEFYLRQKRKIRPGQPDTFQVMTAARVVEIFNKIAVMVTLVATGLVAISLLVGGVGIMNIMLISVSERTREIGLRKAVGARPGAILLQFLVEAVVLCMLGGMLGLALGQGATSVIAKFLPKFAQEQSFIVPPSAVALAFGFSTFVGLVFGMFPAIKASRLDPIEALRHE